MIGFIPIFAPMERMRKLTVGELGRPSAVEAAAAPKMPVTVVLDNVRSLNNVGSFFRTCDAFAVEWLVLCGITGAPPDREIHKTALGAELTVPWMRFATTEEAVERLIDRDYTPLAVEQVRGACPLNRLSIDPTKKYALVFGNEVDGVSQSVVDMCAGAIEIPQAGAKHSLNVAVSGGVVLWPFFCAFRKQL
jgi:tRNA G18 (ribose-2'-O)-methylase SpoU